jgi:hypothetical protein
MTSVPFVRVRSPVAGGSAVVATVMRALWRDRRSAAWVRWCSGGASFGRLSPSSTPTPSTAK